MNVVLVGMPGSGKTVIGKHLSSMLNLPFYDSDEIFVGRYGAVTSYFDAYGEEAFREKERGIMAELAHKNGVVSLGGGAIKNRDGMDALKKNAKVVYLKTDIDILWNRLKTDASRPLLRQGRQALQKLFDERAQLYEKDADYTAVCDGKTPMQIAVLIIDQLQQMN